jgi:hypothetical protein
MTVNMRRNTVAATGAILLAAVALGACGTAEESASADPPIQIEEIPGSEISQITLSESAAVRLDIQTARVESSGDQFVVPSASVIIDPEGVYWVYTNPDSNVFVRERIEPVFEKGLRAYFETGPEVGMSVVIVGVPELYGAEVGIGK